MPMERPTGLKARCDTKRRGGTGTVKGEAKRMGWPVREFERRSQWRCVVANFGRRSSLVEAR